jgi:small subunit ribosomal protein S2
MTTTDIKKLYDVGAHFALPRARRHPTSVPFIFSTKDRTDIFDLEETQKRLVKTLEFVRELSKSGKTLLLVGGKNEVIAPVKDAGTRIGQPFVAGRWIGGTLTNFKIIRKRIDRLEKLTADRESGELDKYTKRERLMIDREIEELLARFGGIVSLRELPGAIFIVDTRHEHTAVREANQMGVPVIGLASSDCDFARIKFPIPANDTSVKSVRFFTELIADAYQEGKKPAAH